MKQQFDMTIYERLTADNIEAMKNHNILTRKVLVSAFGSIKNAAIAKGNKDDTSDELVLEVLFKEKKTLQEMIDTCPIDRPEFLNTYKAMMQVLDRYVPNLITDEEEIRSLILDIVNNEIELIKQNRGQVMKIVMPLLKGKVDMKITNRVICNMLK